MGPQAIDAGLGTPTQRFEGSSRIPLGITIFVVFAIMGAVFLLSAFQTNQHKFNSTSSSPEIGLVAVAIACFVVGIIAFFFIALRYRGMYVQVYSDGFARVQGSKVEAVKWTDVRSVLQSIINHQRYGRTISTTYVYTLETVDKRKMKLSNEIKNIGTLGQLVQQEVTKRLLPQAVADYNSGQSVQFGSLTLNKDGVSQGRKQLSWAEVEGAQVNRGFVTFKKQGGWFKWANVPAAKIPNLFVFLALVDNAVGLKRGR